MNNPVILKKMESLKRCIDRIESRRPSDVELLKKDYDLQDIVSVNLERAVQISVDISAIIIAERGLNAGGTMADSFRVLENEGVISASLSKKMQKSVGFRNISVHEYQSIDWELVFDIIHNHLGNFKNFMKALL